MNKNQILSGGGKNLIGGGKWGRRGREVGEKGEGSGGKGGGNWEWGTPLSTPSYVQQAVKFGVSFLASKLRKPKNSNVFVAMHV